MTMNKTIKTFSPETKQAMKLCECGCGQEIVFKQWHKYQETPRFIKGHQAKGKNNNNYKDGRTLEKT